MLIIDQLRKNDPPLRLLAWGIAVGMFILLGGIWYVQIVLAASFQEVQKNQSFRTVRLPASRGKILDRHGAVLAENRPSYQISLYLEDPTLREQFKKQYRLAKGRQRLSREQQLQLARQSRYVVVSNLVADLSVAIGQPVTVGEAQFTRHYERSLALPFPVLTDLTPLQIARFAESASVPPGFDLEIRSLRRYPHGGTAAHVLGYLTRDEKSDLDEEMFYNYRLPDFAGVTGIEGLFDDYLRGKAGAKSVLVNNLGYRQSENVWTPVESGDNVHLTLDLAIQQAAEQALSQALYNVRGAAVVMDCGNGDVLALVSLPAYDPNAFIPRLTLGVWTNLIDETQRPLINRAIYGTYPPASIFKIVVGLAALEAGWNPTNIVQSPGYAMVGKRRIDDTAPAGDYDFERALKLSCNTYFIQAGLFAGLDRIVSMAQRFHLGDRTGLQLSPESSGILPTRPWIEDNLGSWFDGDTANLCIGQGAITVTPIQMTVLTAALANGGTVYYPRLVDRIESPDVLQKKPVRAIPPGRIRSSTGLSARSLQFVREAMLADVVDPDGTGHDAFHRGRRGPPILDDFRVGGKTGTAEVMKGRTVIDKITWFASFGPYENPRYAVVVMVESGGSGGGTCAPVARKIYQAIQARERAALSPALTMNRN